MAFEASTLVNGEWTTRTLDVSTVLRHYDQQDQEILTNAVEIEKAPVLGLLTQTVIRSPVVHWILPVKLRDSITNDVAFIGDEFVQIKELRSDGHLWDVIRKDNFGYRIRNARVIGSTDAFIRDHEQYFQSTQMKDEDGVDEMDIDVHTNGNSPNRKLLPPQVIFLQLDSGDSVFLMLHQPESGALEFVTSRHRVSKAMLKTQPGMHLAVDPSSRYMAIGCSEGLFAVYALKSREELQEQYSRRSALRYVEAERHIYLEGVIHKIEFLHPSADDKEHVIMLVLVIRKGKTRMLLYEWEAGGDLRDIRAHSRRGHLLEEARQMPLLVIPLTIKSAFILVSASSMSICKDILHGSPRFIDINDRIDPPTPLFHGSGIPLWTSWARPVRLPEYTVCHDDIYFVREDGFIKFIETDCDEEDLVKTEMRLGQLSNNCGPALASLDYITFYNDGTNESGDLLVTSGDSCAGAAYLIKARAAPALTEWIHNWSPAQDLVTNSPNQEDRHHFDQTFDSTHSRGFGSKPDKIFTCAGKGLNGAVTEFRYGLEASIGLEMVYDAQIMDIWVLSSDLDDFHDNGGSLFLLSLGDRSSLLHLSTDASEIVELEPQSTKFDLASLTIAASMHGQTQVQVTEQSIIFASRENVQTFSKDDLLEVHQDGAFLGSGEKLDLAVIHENTVLFTTSIGGTSYLRLVRSNGAGFKRNDPPGTLDTDGIQDLGIYSSNATCLSIGLVAQNICAIFAEHDESRSLNRLTIRPLNATESRVLDIPTRFNGSHAQLQAFTSIIVAPGALGHFLLVCGTLNGVVVTLEINENSFQIVRSWYERVGVTSAIIKRGEATSPNDLVFVNCDMKMFALTIPVCESPDRTPSGKREISEIFLTDALNPIIRQPAINSMATLRPQLSGGTDSGLLLVSGSQILLAGLSTRPKTVPRRIPIRGSPSRLLYSPHLDCLVVAVSVNGKSTLLFIDPETGEDLSRSFDKKNGNPVEFVSGLGNFNERIFRLLEWSYVKGGKIWMFIIVCTSNGRLLIISTQKGETRRSSGNEGNLISESRKTIHYWTLHKIKSGKPVYSVAGSDEGLFYCAGDMLYCETLDDTEKRFKRVAEYSLPSPAINLICNDGTIHALTAAHSLEILKVETDLPSDGAFSVNGTALKIVRTHGDQVTRNTLHHKIISQRPDLPLDLVSDKSCSVVGLWATHGTRADILEPIFEAQLPCSILRFCAGNSRPTWDVTRASGHDRTENLTIVPNVASYPETLGLSIDGSLFSFTLLDFAAWQFLRFVVNLALQSPRVCEFNYTHEAFSLEPALEPKIMMHVDGDILRRCLEDRSLEELLCISQQKEEAEAVQAKFVELLQGLHGKRLPKTAGLSVYVEQAYKDMEFFLRPVL